MNIKNEVLSGIIVAIALVPEAIGFAFVLGVDPMIAIYTTIILGMVTALVGGRPAMITAATGAVASIFVAMVSDYGIEYLFLAVILSGLFQIIFSLLNIGKLVRLISTPIMLGFLNGLAFIMLEAQLGQFYVPGTDELQSGMEMFFMVFLVLLTIGIVVLVPKKIKAVPATLIAIIVGTLLSLLIKELGYTVYTVYDYAGKHLSGGLPKPHIPDVPFNVETLSIILIPAFSAAIVGLIETFLTLSIIDEYTDTKGDNKRAGLGLGLANMVAGCFSGMGGCAMLGQSLINTNNGARTYFSSFMAAFVLLIFVLVASPLLEMIPLGVLVGIMLVVIYKTVAWESIVMHRYAEKFDIFIVIIVTLTTIITHNLAIAVFIGVLVSIFKFTWEKSKNVQITFKENKVEIEGLLFFATMDSIREELTIKSDVIIDFSRAKILDYTAAEAMIGIQNKAKDAGYTVTFENLNYDSEHRIKRVLEK